MLTLRAAANAPSYASRVSVSRAFTIAAIAAAFASRKSGSFIATFAAVCQSTPRSASSCALWSLPVETSSSAAATLNSFAMRRIRAAGSFGSSPRSRSTSSRGGSTGTRSGSGK